MAKKLIFAVLVIVMGFVLFANSAICADSIQILYKCNQTNSTTDTIGPWFEVVNNGTTTISLQRVKIRYWYIKDSTSSQVFECDWAQVGTANVSGSIIQMSNPTSTADNYLEISFAGGAGSLAVGANSGEIQNRIHRNDWTNYNQSNDYSFNPAMTSYSQNLNVTGYIDGTLVFGVEPVTDNQDPSPPVNLSYQITSSVSIYLNWQASTDNVAVIGYKIYRNDVEVGDTNGPTTYYRDSGLTPGTGYTYTVRAYDAVRNLSDASNALGATTDGTISNGFLVIVASPLYYTGNVSSKISQYMTDISGQWTPKLIKVNYEENLGAPANWICKTPADLKEIIKDFGNPSNNNYKGFVLIGSDPSIPSPLWTQLLVGGDSGATDLYYADIDGEWNDVNGDGAFDSLQVVSGTPQNPDFETVNGSLPSNWTTSGSSTFSADASQNYSGDYSAKIVSGSPATSSFNQTISVIPNTNYCLRGYVKTQNVTPSTEGGLGAHLEIGAGVSNNVIETADWTEVIAVFNSEDNTSMDLKCYLGGPDNTCSGTVWFDDLHLYKDIGTTFTPELFYGRITAGPIATSLSDEAAKVESYFSKIHAYRAPGYQDTVDNRGLVYNEGDFFYKGDPTCLAMRSTLPEIRDIYDPALSSPEKFISELEMGCRYGFITIHGTNPPTWCMDSWNDGYSVARWFNTAKLNSISPKVRYLTLNTCYGSLYTEPNLAATFLFNNDYTLNVAGQTVSTCGVEPDEEYYQGMSASCIGIAHKVFVNDILSLGDGWTPVVMVLLGDPTLQYKNPTRANVSPVVTTDLHVVETQVTQELVLPLTIVDPDSTSFTIQVTGLTGATVDSNQTIHWTPTADKLNQSLPVTLQVSDSSGGTYVTNFLVYVSSFKNGQLGINPDTPNNGWTVSVPGHTAEEGYWHLLYGLHTDNDHPVNSMSQTVSNLQQNTDYTLTFMARTLSINTASVGIGTIVEVPLNCAGYTPYSVRFNSGSNNSLPISFSAGSVSDPCEGNLYITSLRLFPTPSYNLGFEQVDGGKPVRWYSEASSLTNVSTFSVENDVNFVHSGSHSAKIVATGPDYARWFQAPITVKPETTYLLSCYIKTAGVTGDVCGANLVVTDGLWSISRQITGTTSGWELVELEFYTGNRTAISVQCHLGDGENLASGTVWFDDLTLVEQP